MIRVTVWNEFRHEKSEPAVRAVYPEGIHGQLASFLAAPDVRVRTATLDEPDNGLPQSVLDETDVLLWWGHMAHGDVEDATVDRVWQRVMDGMGLIVLHSGHFSKIFKKLMGTSCNLKWREDGHHARIWNVKPSHPIAAGIGDHIELEQEEMYGEQFDVPTPDDLIFISWFPGGEVFRSGMTYHRGNGKIFYFQPGHETYRSYYNPDVQRVIQNAVRWCAPDHPRERLFDHFEALENLSDANQ
ncbi:ThuA domain-containing protein [Lacticaseibacillus mingshuiensis]|uniref:ThuA domain-containing protein n=1 Tax=Lacticaseibacillus mingshuiensis TaxID=2799574 RepID=UPI00194F9179|nr:ThuA domain-containing protein [Lacticaseibacillus mingshuiensis]